MKTAKEIERLCVSRETSIIEALARLNVTRSGILLLLDQNGKFERTITDGDLRRLFLSGADNKSSLGLLPEQTSHCIEPGFTGREALARMVELGVSHLPVLDESGKILDVLERASFDEQILLSTPHMGDEERDFVDEAFRTNWIAPLGPNVDAFERELAAKVGTENAVALSSGTAAIHLGLILLGVGQGDVVLCSSLTFVASVNPIIYQGAVPVLVDSEPDSWNMSPQALERALTASIADGQVPKAVIVVGLYGQSADMDPIQEICAKYGVPILEDAAESLGARYKGRNAGTMGDVGIYSFNGNKIITTSAGGMLVTENKEFADRARFLATQARDAAPHYQHSQVGYNYRMSNILAGVGRGQLRVLDDRVQSRRQVYSIYRSELADVEWLEWMDEPDWSYATHWLTACTIKSGGANLGPSDLIHALSEEFIEARPVWKPMQLQPVFENCRYYAHSNNSVSEDLFTRGVCLPSGSNMSESNIGRVIDVIKKFK